MIKRRWAIIWHLILSSLGLLLSIYVSYAIGNWLLAVMNLLSILLLWFYSTTFKRQLLIGNVLISLLTAWVVLVLYFCEFRIYYVFNAQTEEYRKYIKLLFKVAVLYGGFGFYYFYHQGSHKGSGRYPGRRTLRMQNHADRLGHPGV